MSRVGGVVGGSNYVGLRFLKSRSGTCPRIPKTETSVTRINKGMTERSFYDLESSVFLFFFFW